MDQRKVALTDRATRRDDEQSVAWGAGNMKYNAPTKLAVVEASYIPRHIWLYYQMLNCCMQYLLVQDQRLYLL